MYVGGRGGGGGRNHPNQEATLGLQRCKCCDATVGVIVFPMSGDIVQQLLLLAVGFIWDMRQTFWQLT